MSKRKFVTEHEYGGYVIVCKEDKAKMRRDKSKHWTNPGETVLKLVDHGDGITIRGSVDLDLDYSNSSELLDLLMAWDKAEPRWRGRDGVTISELTRKKK